MMSWSDGAIGLAQVGLLLAGVYLTIVQFTRTRASSYIERFNSRDTQEARAGIERWLEKHADTEARLRAIEEDPELAASVKRFANLFQELGAAYQFRVVHRRTVRTLFDALVIMYWERLGFWIHHYRAAADPTLYARFEYLYDEIRVRRGRDQTRVTYIAAYGSLLDPGSASRAIGRDVARAELVPAAVLGWQRTWDLGDRVAPAGAEGAPFVAAFLNVEPAPDRRLHCALLRVAPDELDRLVRREKNYSTVDVTADTRLVAGRPLQAGARVLLFVGRPAMRVRSDDADVRIATTYARRVLEAAAALAPAMAAQVEESLEATPAARWDGEYRFLDPAQAALV